MDLKKYIENFPFIFISFYLDNPQITHICQIELCLKGENKLENSCQIEKIFTFTY